MSTSLMGRFGIDERFDHLVRRASVRLACGASADIWPEPRSVELWATDQRSTPSRVLHLSGNEALRTLLDEQSSMSSLLALDTRAPGHGSLEVLAELGHGRAWRVTSLRMGQGARTVTLSGHATVVLSDLDTGMELRVGRCPARNRVNELERALDWMRTGSASDLLWLLTEVRG